ncbi:FtsX-like permease family protein [Bifidobacterium sp. B4081]|uniref:FtsX-like permease family protein n=1 Tax=unclassified Bifidobacterium TaxID=2608897 RepID=UPI00226ADA27|nr:MULTISPECIES: FtsX-like permease family protein [unclassified Bifidobacterium]MCX8644350.1 FtsX-like permease family protein [Bifidobacterium sp. B4077]MCX8646162.1 FtsX-like permease family protein [Bifidobacterium sp. B4081]MCX8668257.1 FtsX-like permease family protein [Bifidobacterium sp. B3998]
MFVLKNAWFTIRRHAARSLVMVLACLVVMALATTAATVLQADTKARTTDYESQQVDAVISPRRGTKVSPLGWNEYSKYAQRLQMDGMQYKAYFHETANISPDGLPQSGTYSLVGVSDKEAEPTLPHGPFVLDQGKGLDYASQNASGTQTVLISKQMAQANSLKVGDTLATKNPRQQDQQVKLTVSGIYHYRKTAGQAANRAIYTAYPTFAMLGLDTASKPGDPGHELLVAFVLDSPSTYQKFIKEMRKDGLKASQYDIDSPSLKDYQRRMEPVHQAAGQARTTIILVCLLGGLILLGCLFLMLRGRANEIGMAITIGVHKARLGWQFALETLLLTLTGLALGLVLGAVISRPLGRALFRLGSLASMPHAGLIWKMILIGLAVCLALALAAAARVAAFRTAQLYTNDLEDEA